MSRSKNSPQQGKENKTVPGEGEQPSQASSWWPLALIALCTVTTILDKRKPHPSTSPTELQDKKPKRGQTELSASDKKHVWDKWNPQILGNVALIVIQGALFSLFQIVGTSESLQGKGWGVGSCFLIALVGYLIFCFATTMSLSGFVKMGVFLLALAICKIYSGLQGAAIGWSIFFQISILVVAWKASESLKGPNQKWLE